MSTTEVVDELVAGLATRGIHLWREGDRLRFQAPKGALTPEERALLAGQRPQIMALLREADGARTVEMPLSHPQFMMWFQHEQAPTSSLCTIGWALRVRGPLDLGALRHAVQALVDRHAVLRTTYHLREQGLMQHIAGVAQAAFDVRTLPTMPVADLEASWAEELDRHIGRPFNLETGPVMRVALFSDGGLEHLLLATFHHIAADARSTDLLRFELLTLYREFVGNRPPTLPRPTMDYADFVCWQTEALAGAAGARESAYWRGALAAPRQHTTFPAELATPAAPRLAGGSLRFDLDGALVTRLQELAARVRTTPFVVQLAAFQLLLARLCGIRDVLTGTPALGRPTPEFYSVVGNFINVLPVRGRLDPAASITTFLTQLHGTVVDGLDSQHYPLSRMIQELQISRDGSGQALFNTSFTLLKSDPPREPSAGQIPDTVFSWHPLVLQAGLLDLSIDVFANDSSLHCVLKHSLVALSGCAAAGVAKEYERLLGAMIAGSSERLGVLLDDPGGFLPASVRARLLLDALAARDVRITIDAGQLRVNGPKGAVDAALREAIAELRPAIIARLVAATTQGTGSDFWRSQLDGAPVQLALPVDRSRTARRGGGSTRHGRLTREAPAAALLRLRAVCEAGEVDFAVILLAAWQVLLHRYCSQDDIVVATRSGLLGAQPRAAAIPVRGRLAGNPPFKRFLEQVCGTLAAAALHDACPKVRCQVSFDTNSEVPPSRRVACMEDDERELGLEINLKSDAVEQAPAAFTYSFSTDLFEAETIERLHENYSTLLDAVATDPDRGVDDLELSSRAEMHRYRRNRGELAHFTRNVPRCVHQQVADTVWRHPQRIAISAPDGDLRYDALEERANRLAHHLLAAGVTRGALVAVCLERSVHVPIALAAVLKAGAAYVPLDPTHPRTRLRHIIRDAGIAFLITQGGLEQIAEDMATRVIRVDTAADQIAARSPGPPEVVVGPGDLAYVIYTSGSTGKPKGVEVEHGNLASFLEAMRLQIGMTGADVLLAVTTLAFDIAGLELWLPLVAGARIVFASREVAVDGMRLAALLDEHRVSVMQATPATWRLLLEAGWAGRRSLRALCGGEAMPVTLAAQLAERVGDLWNMYGPTETTIWSTAARVGATTVEGAPELIPIGRPLANTVVRIEDAAGRLVPAGAAGELLIGGTGVARGYRDQPDLTSRAFVTRTEDGESSRWYRTGDLARFRCDGQLEFLGRRDHQIKLRGYRIEPAEIELLLAAQPGVTNSIVIARTETTGDERLVAFLTVSAGASIDPHALRSVLRESLPEYMVPAHFAVLASLPLTPNGKIDRAALAVLDLPEAAANAADAASAPAVPMSKAQQRVAVLWRDVLRRDRIGLNDNFFDIGGHSLLLVRIHAGLKREFGCDLPLVELFQHTTVAQQAKVMEQTLRV